MKEKLQKARKLKKIILSQLGVDINKVSRVKHIVEARYIYFTILREKECFTLDLIGSTVNKDHATVLHGTKALNVWIKYDKSLNQKYKNVLKAFQKNKMLNNHGILDLFEQVPENKLPLLQYKIQHILKLAEYEENQIKINKAKSKIKL